MVAVCGFSPPQLKVIVMMLHKTWKTLTTIDFSQDYDLSWIWKTVTKIEGYYGGLWFTGIQNSYLAWCLVLFSCSPVHQQTRGGGNSPICYTMMTQWILSQSKKLPPPTPVSTICTNWFKPRNVQTPPSFFGYCGILSIYFSTFKLK